METVRHIVGQTRQRLTARLIASHAGTGGAIGVSLACLIACGTWLFLSEATATGILPFGLSATWLPLTAAAVGGLLGALAGSARALWLRPSLLMAAAELDRLARLNDALSSALAFAARATPPSSPAQALAQPASITAGLQQAAMDDAERLARALSPKALIPLSPPRAWPLTLAALALAAGIPQIAPPGWLRSQPSPAQFAANPPPPTAAQLAESVRATEALAAAIAAKQAAPDPAAPDASASADRPADEAIRRELATLEQIKRELEGGPNGAPPSPSAQPSAPGSARTGQAQSPGESSARPAPQRAAESLNRLADAVTEQARTAQAAADGLRERLRSAADELAATPAPNPAGSQAPSESLAHRGREIADALSRGDVATAQRKLDQLAGELPSASEEDRNKLARDLSRFAAGLDKARPDKPSPGKQPDAASSPTGDPQSSSAAQQLEQAGLSPERARQLAEQLGSATRPDQRAAAEDAVRRELAAQGRSEQDAADRARQAATAASEQAKQAEGENQTRQRSKTLADRLRDLAEQVKAKQQREKDAQQPKPSQPPQQPEPASPPAANPASQPAEQPNRARDPAQPKPSQSQPSQTQPFQTDPAQANPAKPDETGQPDRARENGKQPHSQPSDPSSSPGERSTQPSQNGQPGESKQPGQQNQPSQSNTPSQSGSPSQQNQPDQPTKPAPSGQPGEQSKPSDAKRNPQPGNSPNSTPSGTPAPTPGSRPDASTPPSATGQQSKPQSDPSSPSASAPPSAAEKPTADPAKSPSSNAPSPRDGTSSTLRPGGKQSPSDPSTSKPAPESSPERGPARSPESSPDVSPDAAPDKRPSSRSDNKQDKTPGNTPSPTPTEQPDKGAPQSSPNSPSQRATRPPANAEEAIRKMREELDRLERDSNAPAEAARDSKALREQAKRLIDGMDDKQRQEAMELARRYAERTKSRAQPAPNDRRPNQSPGQPPRGSSPTEASPAGAFRAGQTKPSASPIDPSPEIAKQFGLQEAAKGPNDRLSPLESKQSGSLDARRPGNTAAPSGPQRTLAEWSGSGGKVQPAQQADAAEIIESAAAGAQQAIEREQVPRRLENLVTTWYRRLPQAVGLPPAAPAKPGSPASPTPPASPPSAEPSGGTKP